MREKNPRGALDRFLSMGIRFSAAALVALFAFTVTAAAAPGDLDATFSGNGWVRTLDLRGGSAPYMPRGAEDVALQPDGKILAVGDMAGGSSYSAFGVFRYTPNGELDRSFGQGGWVATEVGTFEHAHALALQKDGKILLAGEADCGVLCFGLLRYHPNGTLDQSFGQGGVVKTEMHRCGCDFYSVAVQPNGRIVAAGRVFNYLGQIQAVVRYLPDGRLDRTFARNGILSFHFGYGGLYPPHLALQPDGKIVVVGWGGRGTDFTFARLRPNGTFDRSFSRDGRQTVNFGRDREDGANAVALQRDGRIVAAGMSRTGRVGPTRFAVVRLTRNGALDRSFGRGGKVLTRPAPLGGHANAVLIQPEGLILVGGLAVEERTYHSSNWALLRYRANGRLDRSFGRAGIVISNFGTGEDWAGALARQSDGKIVVAGEVYRDQAVARYLMR